LAYTHPISKFEHEKLGILPLRGSAVGCPMQQRLWLVALVWRGNTTREFTINAPQVSISPILTDAPFDFSHLA